MILGDAHRVARGKLSHGCVVAGIAVARPSQRRLQQTRVAEPGAPTVLGELFFVDCQYNGKVYPFGLFHWDRPRYFASSRRIARRFFMTLRATAICLSNSGLNGVSR